MLKIRTFSRFYRKALLQPRYAVVTALRRFRAAGAYYIGKGKSPMPEAVTLYLTHLCNLKCHMCGQWGSQGTRREMEQQAVRAVLPLARLESLLDEFAAFKPGITLFGGEPLLHPECIELIRAVKQRGMHCVMITNGTLLERHAVELAASGLDELNVSVDGRGALHDEIRGVPGSYERIIRGLALIRDRATKKGRRTPIVNLQSTVNRLNHKRLSELAEAAREAGAASLTIHNLIFLRPDELFRQREFDQRLGVEARDWRGFGTEPGVDWRSVQAGVKALRAGRHSFAIDMYPNFNSEEMLAYYSDVPFRAAAIASRCFSPWMTAYVFPDGTVRPCLNSPYAFGTVLQTSFAAAWNSPEALRYRRLLRGAGAFPACARCTELYRY